MTNCIVAQGYKFLLFGDKESDISLSACSQNTHETFAVKDWKLNKISKMTIEAALKKQTPTVKYSITRTQKQLFLTIIINLEYLPTIEEKIILQLIEGYVANKQAILNEMKVQIALLERQLQFAAKGSSVILGTISNISGYPAKFTQQLQSGTYLLQISGIAAGCQNCDDDFDMAEFNFSTPIALVIDIYEGMNQKQVQSFESFETINSKNGHEYPFACTKTIKLKNKGWISVQLKCPNFQLTLTNSYAVITPVVITDKFASY